MIQEEFIIRVSQRYFKSSRFSSFNFFKNVFY